MARILVIDDDASVRTSFQYALGLAGHEVLLATNGEEGLRQHLKTPADVVIVDLFMPEKEGLETIMELRKQCPNVPVIAVSGGYRTSGPMLHVAEQLGAARVLEKPFQVAELLNMIDEVLGKKTEE